MPNPSPNPSHPVTGCAEINARQRAAYLKLNDFTEEEADQLSRWCRKETDVWPWERG